jgi:hypothetical protein
MFHIIDGVGVSLRYNALQEKLNVSKMLDLLPVVFGIAS